MVVVSPPSPASCFERRLITKRTIFILLQIYLQHPSAPGSACPQLWCWERRKPHWRPQFLFISLLLSIKENLSLWKPEFVKTPFTINFHILKCWLILPLSKGKKVTPTPPYSWKCSKKSHRQRIQPSQEQFPSSRKELRTESERYRCLNLASKFHMWDW